MPMGLVMNLPVAGDLSGKGLYVGMAEPRMGLARAGGQDVHSPMEVWRHRGAAYLTAERLGSGQGRDHGALTVYNPYPTT